MSMTQDERFADLLDPHETVESIGLLEIIDRLEARNHTLQAANGALLNAAVKYKKWQIQTSNLIHFSKGWPTRQMRKDADRLMAEANRECGDPRCV